MPQALGLVETKGLVGAIVAADAMLKAANVTLIGKEKVTPALITIKIIGETAAVKSAIEAGAAAAQRVGQLISTHLIPHPDNQLSRFFPELTSEPIVNVVPQVMTTEKIQNVEIPPKVEKVKKEPKPKKEKKIISIEETEKVTSGIVKVESTERKVASLFDEVVEPEIRHSKNILDRLKAEALSDLQSEENSIDVVEGKSELSSKEDVVINQVVPAHSVEDLDTLNVHQLRKLARGVDEFPIHGREISRANRETLLAYFRSIKK